MTLRLFIRSLLVIVSLGFQTLHAQSTFAGGSGTEADPYLVATAEHLDQVRNHLGAHFRQTADISLSGYASGSGWTSIGTLTAPFTGRYDGQRFALSNLTQSGTVQRAGLFGVLSGAVVSNVRLTAVNLVVTADSVGALAGLARSNALVQTSSVEGTIQGRLSVGGLVGYLSGSNVVTSYSAAQVTGVAEVGGLVGRVQNSGLRSVYSVATVRAAGAAPLYSDGFPMPQSAGGIAGYLGSARVERVYADADVASVQTIAAGQLAGYGISCEVVGLSVFNSEHGQSGVALAGLPIASNYCGIGIGRTPVEMRSPDYYSLWPFGSVWRIEQVGASSYPYLIGVEPTVKPGLGPAFFAAGTGTAGDPYQVATAEQLSNVRYFPTMYFVQTADISLAHIPDWQPIYSPMYDGFAGSYNGAGYRISGLTIRSSAPHVGLFSKTSSSGTTFIENLQLTDVDVRSTSDEVGALVGTVQGAPTIRRVSVSGSVIGATKVGGLVGTFVGYFPMSEVYSDATVQGHHLVGGLVGYMTGSAEIRNAYSLATVVATDAVVGTVGGVAGGFNSDLTVVHAYVDATLQGAVIDHIGTGDYNDFGTPIYNADQVFVNYQGKSGAVDGALSRTPNQLRQQSTFSGWDFSTIWTIDGGTGSGSYPYLRNVGPDPLPGPRVFGLVAPALGAADMAIRPTFTWTSTLPGADRYDLQISLSRDFTGTGWLFEDLTTTSYQIGANLPGNRVYHWRVRSKISATNQVGDWSISGLFSTRPFWQGTGTTGDPYQVNDAYQLDNIRHFLASHFIQTADISLEAFQSGAGWTPIGSLGTPFTGTFNGQQFAITGLRIDTTSTYVGLFSVVSGVNGMIQNVRLTDVDVVSSGNVVGSLVGRIQLQATVQGSSVEGTVLGGIYVGGLVGQLVDAGRLFTSYSLADVTATNTAGVLVGHTDLSIIRNVYAVGRVEATSQYAGGLIGYIASSLVDRSYADSEVIGTSRGLITGGVGPGVNLSNLFMRARTGIGASGTGQSIATALAPFHMRQSALFSGFDFDTVWQIDNQNGSRSYPYLRLRTQNPAPGLISTTLPATWDTNPGTSFSLNGSTTIRFPYEAELNPAAFTVEAWVRPTSIGSQARTVVSSRNGGAGYELGLSADGTWSAWSGTAAGGTTLTGGAAAADTWTHLALVHTGTVARFYVNGRLADEEITTLQANAASDLVIGGTFIGQLDEVRIWSDAASAQTLRLRMHEAPVAAESTLRLHLPFDEADGAVVFDRSGGERWTVAEGTAGYSAQVHPAGSFINGTQDAWYFLANPTSGITLAQFLEPLWTQGAAGADSPTVGSPNVFVLNETLGTYQAVTDLNVPAVPGKGYLVRVFKNDTHQVEGTFPKRLSVPRAQAPATVELPVTYTPSHAFAGFSLVGNPYPHSLDLGSEAWEFSSVAPTVYVYDQSINNYRTWNRNTGSGSNSGTAFIAPNQGFLMMASAASPVIRAPRTARASSASALLKSSEIEPIRLDLTLSRGDRQEQMQVLLMEEDRVAPVRDMSRQLEPLHPDRFMIHAVDPATGLKIETYERSIHASDILDLPVHAEISTEGENTLRFSVQGELDPEWAVMLLDTRTGIRTDLRTHPMYAFSGATSAMKAAPSDSLVGMLTRTMSADAARFRLLIGPASQLPSDEELPTDVALAQNYPNPFNPSTVIGVQLPVAGHTRLTVYDILGREVAVLIDGPMQAGRHQVTFDASGLAGGVYVYRLTAGGKVLSRKMTLVK